MMPCQIDPTFLRITYLFYLQSRCQELDSKQHQKLLPPSSPCNTPVENQDWVSKLKSMWFVPCPHIPPNDGGREVLTVTVHQPWHELRNFAIAKTYRRASPGLFAGEVGLLRWAGGNGHQSHGASDQEMHSHDGGFGLRLKAFPFSRFHLDLMTLWTGWTWKIVKV